MRMHHRTLFAAWVLLLLAASMMRVSAVVASPFSLPVGAVIIDPGHGGTDPGAVAEGHDFPAQEKEITLDLALRVARMLKERDSTLEVILTRGDDSFVALADRAHIAARHNPSQGKQAILVSIHVNSSPTAEASGFEILVKRTDKRVSFLDPSVEDWAILRFANHTAGELNRLLNRENMLLASHMDRMLRDHFPAARARGIKEQDVWVLNASKVPSVLVELAFISNPGEAALMAQSAWRERMATAIIEGLCSYINRD